VLACGAQGPETTQVICQYRRHEFACVGRRAAAEPHPGR